MKKPWPRWLKWTIPAVCLCAAMVLTLPLLHRPAEVSVPAQADEEYESDAPGGCKPPNFTVDGRSFVVSPSLSGGSQTLPEGFACAGETDYCYEYYTNPAIPEHIYVYEPYMYIDEVDSTGNVVGTMPVYRYQRYVDERLRGKELICCRGEYYISMLSADYFTGQPDVNRAYYDQMCEIYGKRIEGDVPEGFVSAGRAEFSGYDTVPQGELSCNVGAMPIYVNPDEPDVVLFPTIWQTAPLGAEGETNHKGFKVYIRYDCPFV